MASTCWFRSWSKTGSQDQLCLGPGSCQCYPFLTAVMGLPCTDANISCCPNTLQLLSMPFWLFVVFLNYLLQLHQQPLYHGYVNHLNAPVRLCPLIIISQTTDLCLLLPFVDLFPFFKCLTFPSALHTKGALFRLLRVWRWSCQYFIHC